MLKKKISKKHGLSLEDMNVITPTRRKGIYEVNPDPVLRNPDLIAKALWECLVDNDIAAFKEILQGHLNVVNKEKVAKRSGVPRRTLYRMLSPEGNPTLANLGKIIHEICA